MRWIGTCAKCGRLGTRRRWFRPVGYGGHREPVRGTGCLGDINFCIDSPCPRDPLCVAYAEVWVHDDCGVAYASGAPTPEEERLWQEAGDMV